MRCDTDGPASCAKLQGCFGTCSWGRESNGEGCHQRWPKGGEHGGVGGVAYQHGQEAVVADKMSRPSPFYRWSQGQKQVIMRCFAHGQATAVGQDAGCTLLCPCAVVEREVNGCLAVATT
jgi:hypothetical protein